MMKKFSIVAWVTVTHMAEKHRNPWYNISLSHRSKNGILPLAALLLTDKAKPSTLSCGGSWFGLSIVLSIWKAALSMTFSREEESIFYVVDSLLLQARVRRNVWRVFLLIFSQIGKFLGDKLATSIRNTQEVTDMGT